MKRLIYFVFAACLICSVSCKKDEPVPVAVTGVEMNYTQLDMVVGDTQKVTVTVLPENADNKEYSFSVSPASVVSVSDAGKITALAEGSAIVTVTTADGGKTANLLVVVKEADVNVSSVSLNKTELTLIIGDDYQLVADVLPENATDKTVTWSVDKPEVASVTDGKVVALKEGAAVVTATTKDGNKTATCSVTVNKPVVPVESVTLSQTTWNPAIGEEITLVATVLPENATNKDVIWSVDDKYIVSVDDKGLVKALAFGPANVTVSTVDGAKTAVCEVFVRYQPTESITMSDPEAMEVGEKQTLTVTVLPAEADQEFIWSYEPYDGSIITMDEITGEITAVAPGQAVVTATTVDGKSVSKTVTVKEPFTVTSLTDQAWAGQSIELKPSRLIKSVEFSVPASCALDTKVGKGTVYSHNNVSLGLYRSTSGVSYVVDALITITATSLDGATATCTVLSKGWEPQLWWGDDYWAADEIPMNTLFEIKIVRNRQFVARSEFETFLTLTAQRDEAVCRMESNDTDYSWAYYYDEGHDAQAYDFIISCGSVRFSYSPEY